MGLGLGRAPTRGPRCGGRASTIPGAPCPPPGTSTSGRRPTSRGASNRTPPPRNGSWRSRSARAGVAAERRRPTGLAAWPLVVRTAAPIEQQRRSFEGAGRHEGVLTGGRAGAAGRAGGALERDPRRDVPDLRIPVLRPLRAGALRGRGRTLGGRCGDSRHRDPRDHGGGAASAGRGRPPARPRDRGRGGPAYARVRPEDLAERTRRAPLRARRALATWLGGPPPTTSSS